MNNRIAELAEESGFMDTWFSESGDDCEQEIKKLAKLIIQECAESVCKTDLEDVEGGDSAVLYAAAEQLKQRFGV